MPVSEQSLSRPFGLLVEGYQPGVYDNAVSYVRQGKKIHFFKGGLKDAFETADTGLTLVESLSDFDLIKRVNEDTGVQYEDIADSQWVYEGVHQRSDTRNINKRTYRRAIWDRLIEAADSYVQARVRARGMYGHAEHPEDGRMNMARVGVLTRSLKLRKGGDMDGVVWGVGEALDFGDGVYVRGMMRNRLQWGVSSRGKGSISADGDVNDDYVLETFDAVTRPSTPGADKMYRMGVDSKPRRASVTVPESVKRVLESEQNLVVMMQAVDTAVASGVLDAVQEATALRDIVSRMTLTTPASVIETAVALDRRSRKAAQDATDARVVEAVNAAVSPVSSALEESRAESSLLRFDVEKKNDQLRVCHRILDEQKAQIAALRAENRALTEAASSASVKVRVATVALKGLSRKRGSDILSESTRSSPTGDKAQAKPPVVPMASAYQRGCLPQDGLVVESASPVASVGTGVYRSDSVVDDGVRLAGNAINTKKG